MSLFQASSLTASRLLARPPRPWFRTPNVLYAAMVSSSRRVRLVATDLDGTLLRDDLTISARTRESLRAAQRAGIQTVMVTARPPRRMRSLSKALGLEGVVICPNGALLYSHPFDALLALVHRHAGADAHVHSGSDFVEVSAAGVTKAAAVAAYGAERGISASEVVAVGDMPNDLPMLRWAGWSVAVANAHPDVLASCDARTASNNDDGVVCCSKRSRRITMRCPRGGPEARTRRERGFVDLI